MRFKALGVLVVTLATVAAGSSSADVASARVHAPTFKAHVQISGLGAVQPATATSNIGAGYWVYPGSPNVSSASAQFTVPAVSCSGTKPQGVFPGIWIYDSAGNLTQQVDVNLFCSSGQLYMVDVICITGSSAGCVEGLTINPGDRIIATFSESSFHTQGQIYDLTTGQADYIYDGSPAPTNDYTVFIGDAGPVPFAFGSHVPVFTRIPFTKAQVDGYYLFEYGAFPTALKSNTAVQVKTSALLGDGDAFNTTFAHV